MSVNIDCGFCVPEYKFDHIDEGLWKDIIWNRNCHSTLSKALEKSSLRKIVSCLDFLAHDRVSCVSRMLSKINLFFR